MYYVNCNIALIKFKYKNMRNVLILLGVLLINISFSFSQKSFFVKTDEVFKNGKFVWSLEFDGNRVGEFWPINAINLITKTTNESLFDSDKTLLNLLSEIEGVATAPDGMTTGHFGSRVMEGKSLANGVPCGDGVVYNYGIILVENNGYGITFTHKQEIEDYTSFYETHKNLNNTIFFLPSIYRNGKYISSNSNLDKVIVRRETYDGVQIGVIIFDDLLSYNEAREIILELDRPGRSKTTHIYMLDGGGIWGQAAKHINGNIKTIGRRNPEEVTNYLVFY